MRTLTPTRYEIAAIALVAIVAAARLTRKTVGIISAMN